MATLVTAQWVEQHLDAPHILLLDPRRPMRYLQGHLKHAVNLPVYKAFDADGKLLPDAQLQRWIGAAGLDDQATPVIYDSFDGQNGAMVAWLLEYFGRADVRLLNIFFERWVAEGHEVFYKPVLPVSKAFTAQVNSQIRMTLDDLRRESDLKLIDFRSREEYTGEQDRDGQPGHAYRQNGAELQQPIPSGGPVPDRPAVYYQGDIAGNRSGLGEHGHLAAGNPGSHYP